MVCPDKSVTEIGQVSAAAHYAAKDDCPAWVSGVNNVAAGSYSGTGSVVCGEESTITPKLTIINLGSDNLTECTVSMSVDGGSEVSIEWTGDLATLENAQVTFDDITVSSSAELTFNVTNPNGVADESAGNNILTEVLGSERAGVEVTFQITTDFWPEEITWQLKDDTGATLFSNEDEGVLTCDNTYTQVYTLEHLKCYTFSIQDSFGDGILNGPINPNSHSCGTDNGLESMAMGAISITSDMGLLFGDIDYGSGNDIEFIVLDPLSNQELSLEGLNLYPNPASDNVNLSFGLAESTKLQVTIYNMLGQAVKSVNAQTYGAGNHTLEINTAGITNGMYFVNISDGDATVARKLTIAK